MQLLILEERFHDRLGHRNDLYVQIYNTSWDWDHIQHWRRNNFQTNFLVYTSISAEFSRSCKVNHRRAKNSNIFLCKGFPLLRNSTSSDENICFIRLWMPLKVCKQITILSLNRFNVECALTRTFHSELELVLAFHFKANRKDALALPVQTSRAAYLVCFERTLSFYLGLMWITWSRTLQDLQRSNL